MPRMHWCIERVETTSKVPGTNPWTLIVTLESGASAALAWHGNPVTTPPPPAPPGLPHAPVVRWSGTLAPTLFEGDPRNWMAPGRKALHDVLTRLASVDHASGILLRPHARHLLSDIPSCATLLREHADAVGLAFAPMSLLETPMLTDLADHLSRSFEVLGPSASMVFLHDVSPPTDPDEPLVPRPLGTGVMPRGLLRGLIRDHVRPGTPIVLLDGDVEKQLVWLGEG